MRPTVSPPAAPSTVLRGPHSLLHVVIPSATPSSRLTGCVGRRTPATATCTRVSPPPGCTSTTTRTCAPSGNSTVRTVRNEEGLTDRFRSWCGAGLHLGVLRYHSPCLTTVCGNPSLPPTLAPATCRFISGHSGARPDGADHFQRALVRGEPAAPPGETLTGCISTALEWARVGSVDVSTQA